VRNPLKLAAMVVLVSWVAVTAAPGPSAGQDRLSLDALKVAMCEKADFDGDTYRPKVCDARCDCLTDPLIQNFASCSETSQGNFEFDVIGASPGVCLGYCDNQLGFCNVDPDCNGGTCTGPKGCMGPTCNVVSDCPPGYDSCSGNTLFPPEVKFCGGAEACEFDQECPDTGVLVAANLFLVAPVGDPAPALCKPPAIVGAESEINSKDANACLEFIEAQSGLDCGFRCGNGLLDAGEQCDDGNNTPADGCDANCVLE
jgi:cysteine-rich repeat protein